MGHYDSCRDYPESDLPRPSVTFADHSYPAYSAKQMRDAIHEARAKAFEEAAQIADCGCNNPGCELDEISRLIRSKALSSQPQKGEQPS